MPEGISLTSNLFWESAIVVFLVDIVLVVILYRLLDLRKFIQIKWFYIITAALFWGIFGLGLVYVFWEAYYQFFYPGWLHGWGILLIAPLEGLIASVITYWAAVKIGKRPIIPVIIIIGVEAFVEHLYGIFSFKIMQIEMLRDVDVRSVLAFSIPEYILYWCWILFLAMGFQKLAVILRGKR